MLFIQAFLQATIIRVWLVKIKESSSEKKIVKTVFIEFEMCGLKNRIRVTILCSIQRSKDFRFRDF